MNWIGRQRKKEFSDQKKVNRGTVALVALGFMILIVIAGPRRKAETENQLSQIEIWMDQAVDSLIQGLGYADYSIYHKGGIETLYQTLEFPEEDEIARLRLRQEIVDNNPSLTDKEKIRQMEEIQLSIETLQAQADRRREMRHADEPYYSRRIRFTTDDGRQYTFFEQMLAGHFRTRYFMETTGTGSAAEDYERTTTENNNEQNTDEQ